MEIKEAKYKISSPSLDKCPAPDRPEYAFIGRSNVGKSSLINMLCNNSKLAKISSTPGKTKLLNYFEITSTLPSSHLGKGSEVRWYIVDLPGYGYASVSQKERRNWSKMAEDYIRKRKNLVCLFVLIDSRQKPQALDLEFINQLGEWRIPFAIVFTKTDKNKPEKTKEHLEEFFQSLATNWEERPVYFLSSSVKKTGRREILDYIVSLNKMVGKKNQ